MNEATIGRNYAEALLTLARRAEGGEPEEWGALLDAIAVLRELTPRSSDAIPAYGERLSSLIVAAHFDVSRMPAQLLDAREFIITDDRFTSALPLLDEIDARSRATVSSSRQRQQCLGVVAADRRLVHPRFFSVGEIEERKLSTIFRFD